MIGYIDEHFKGEAFQKVFKQYLNQALDIVLSAIKKDYRKEQWET